MQEDATDRWRELRWAGPAGGCVGSCNFGHVLSRCVFWLFIFKTDILGRAGLSGLIMASTRVKVLFDAIVMFCFDELNKPGQSWD